MTNRPDPDAELTAILDDCDLSADEINLPELKELDREIAREAERYAVEAEREFARVANDHARKELIRTLAPRYRRGGEVFESERPRVRRLWNDMARCRYEQKKVGPVRTYRTGLDAPTEEQRKSEAAARSRKSYRKKIE